MSKQVKRYRHSEPLRLVIEDEIGIYVLYEDYAALEKKLDECSEDLIKHGVICHTVGKQYAKDYTKELEALNAKYKKALIRIANNHDSSEYKESIAREALKEDV
jgi:hypothetical protein